MNRLLSLALATLCLLLPMGAQASASSVTGRAPATVGTASSAWGRAKQVPGLASLAAGGHESGLTSVSCASPGNCSAGGFYVHGQSCCTLPFLVSQVGGTWQDALPVPGIDTLNKPGADSQVTSVSCASPGNCAAGGYYTSGFYGGGGAPEYSAFVVSQVNGTWGTAQEVPGIDELDTGGRAKLVSVSCASPGSCSAGGWFYVASGGPGCCNSEGFVVSEVGGTWGTAQQVAGTAEVYSVSCASPGNCGAAASRVLTQTDGTWGTARKIATPPRSNFGAAKATVISCPSPGDCGAAGSGVRRTRAIVVSQSVGVWGTAIRVPGTQNLNKSLASQVTSISCASRGNCTAGGYAFKNIAQGSSSIELAAPFLVIERNGTWGGAAAVPGIATLSKNGYAIVTSVSCATPRNCAAAGSFATSGYNPEGSGPGQVFVTSEVDGRWGTPRDVTAALGNDGPAEIAQMACPAAGRCSAAGYYFLPNQEVAFVISQVR